MRHQVQSLPAPRLTLFGRFVLAAAIGAPLLVLAAMGDALLWLAFDRCIGLACRLIEGIGGL